MEVPFKLTDKTTGLPITNLTKSDVVLKMSEAPYTVMDYTDLGTVGSAYGEYVLWGVNFIPTSCRLYIKTVVQDDWFGAQILGDYNLLYATKTEFGSVSGSFNSSITSLQTATGVLSSAVATKAGLTSNNQFTGYNTFNGISVSGANSHFYTPTNFHGNGYCDTPTVGTMIANKAYVDNASTASASGLYATLSGTNEFAQRQTFNGGITLSGGNSYVWAPINLKTWGLCDAPLYGTSVVNKSYVQSEINTQLGSFSTSGYQESRNIIRLIPNGTEQAGKVYTTYSSALAYASVSASLTSQYTILICGNGINATSIDITEFKDYVHIRGLGSNIKLNISGLSLSAGSVGNAIVENATLVETEGSAGQNLTNLVFTRCNFEEINNPTIFTTCKFVGMCYFSTDTDNTFQFQNSSGTIATDEHTVIVAGTSKVNILAPDKFSINSITLQDDGTQFYINSGLKIDQGAQIGGETKINGRLNVTGDANFVSSTITLSATNISLSGVLKINQTPTELGITPDKVIEIIGADGNTYYVPVQQK